MFHGHGPNIFKKKRHQRKQNTNWENNGEWGEQGRPEKQWESNQGWGNQKHNQNNGWGNVSYNQNEDWGSQNQPQNKQKGQGPNKFMANMKEWGNNLHGNQWVNEQTKRQEYNNMGQANNINIQNLIQEQVIYIEPSPQKKKIEQLIKKGQAFEDERFPPNQTSLSGEYGPRENWSKIRWERISEIMPNAKIFQGKIQPGDISQGYLGDCYLLAGLAAIAQRPDRIFNLFLMQETNEAKYYSVKMLYKGKWMTIDLDEWIPCMSGKPAFTRAKQNEIWVVLLEKAWAKLYTSFRRIAAGYPQQALHDMTGAPCKQINFHHSSFDKERDWQYLLMASEKEYAMVSSSQPGSDTTKSYTGVVNGHAYTFLNATYLNFRGEKVRIVQLRNPWGKGESKSAWSDDDPNWKEIDETEKKRVGFNLSVDDGIFFMSYDEYIKEFRAMTIAEINDDASYVYRSTKDPQNKGVYYNLYIIKAGTYSLHIDKNPERSYPDKVQDDFRYPNASITIGKLEGNIVSNKSTASSKYRTLYKTYNLQPGNYIVKANIDYESKFEKDFDVNLAIYAEFPCELNWATHNQAAALTENSNVEWTGNVQDEGGSWNQMGNKNWEKEHGGKWGRQGGDDGWGHSGGNNTDDGWGNNYWGNQGGNQGGNHGGNHGGNQGWGNQGGNQGGNDGWGNQGSNQGGNHGGNQGWGNQGSNQGRGNQGANDGWGNQGDNQGSGNPNQGSEGWRNQGNNDGW